jgi:DNA repair protein RadC
MSLSIIQEAGCIAGLASWTPAQFQALKGIGRIKALQLATLVEVSRRMISGQSPEKPLLNRPELVTAFMAPVATGLEIEKFWVLCLNRKNRLIKRVEITSGTATAALAHPREVFVSRPGLMPPGAPGSNAATLSG